MTTALTKSSAAYERARRDIVSGLIPTNEPIDEAELGARYELGRTPIREALKRLCNDQLIVWPDRRSPYVPEMGVSRVQSLYEARTIFETQIAVLAAERVTEAIADRLDRLVQQEADLVERNLPYEAAEVDLLFHQGVAEATGNPFLVDASTRINTIALRIWHHMIATEEMLSQEHADIVDALRERDSAKAVGAVQRHITNAYRRYIHMTSRLTVSSSNARDAG